MNSLSDITIDRHGSDHIGGQPGAHGSHTVNEDQNEIEESDGIELRENSRTDCDKTKSEDFVEPKSSTSQNMNMSPMREVLLQLRSQNIDYNRSDHVVSGTYSGAYNGTSHGAIPVEWTREVVDAPVGTADPNCPVIIPRARERDDETPSSCVCSSTMCWFVFGAVVGTFTVPLSIIFVLGFCTLPCIREEWKDKYFFSGVILGAGIGFVLAMILILVLKGLEVTGHI